VKFWEFRNSIDGIGELVLYGEIANATWWGDETTPTAFKRELDDLGKVVELKVYINSGGGDVFAGNAIYNMLKRLECKKTVYIDGLAASIASVVAMAGDEIIMYENSMMMVHNAFAHFCGNAYEFRKMADDLETISKSILATYVSRGTLGAEEMQRLMDAETWITPSDAVNYGLCTKVEGMKKVSACMTLEKMVFGTIEVPNSRYSNPPVETDSGVLEGAGEGVDILADGDTSPLEENRAREAYELELQWMKRRLKDELRRDDQSQNASYGRSAGEGESRKQGLE
jgi:ATP-dependent Clp protease, protease subunit